jgi:hypothetical protein
MPLTCKEMTSKIGGSIKPKDENPSSQWFIGDTAEFCCEEGNWVFMQKIVIENK